MFRKIAHLTFAKPRGIGLFLTNAIWKPNIRPLLSRRKDLVHGFSKNTFNEASTAFINLLDKACIDFFMF